MRNKATRISFLVPATEEWRSKLRLWDDWIQACGWDAKTAFLDWVNYVSEEREKELGSPPQSDQHTVTPSGQVQCKHPSLAICDECGAPFCTVCLFEWMFPAQPPPGIEADPQKSPIGPYL